MHCLMFCSYCVFRAQKNKLLIFINVNLHIVDRIGPLAVCENCISNPTVYFAQSKIELEGLH